MGGIDGMGGLGRLCKWMCCGRRNASHTGVFCFLCSFLLFLRLCDYHLCFYIHYSPLSMFVYVVCVCVCVCMSGVCVYVCISV